MDLFLAVMQTFGTRYLMCSEANVQAFEICLFLTGVVKLNDFAAPDKYRSVFWEDNRWQILPAAG